MSSIELLILLLLILLAMPAMLSRADVGENQGPQATLDNAPLQETNPATTATVTDSLRFPQAITPGHRLKPHLSSSRPSTRLEMEQAAMPAEIREGRLVISEKTFRRSGRWPLFAKTDQVFETTDGLLVPIETKNRLYLIPGDLVQLSAQAAALRSTYGNKVAGHGYLRVALAGGAGRYFRYDLLDDKTIDRLVERYQQLKSRERRPIARPGLRKCERCVFTTSCKVQRGR